MFNNDFDPYMVLEKLTEAHKQTQQQLKVVDTNIKEIAKAHNELRNQVIYIEKIIMNIKEKINETT